MFFILKKVILSGGNLHKLWRYRFEIFTDDRCINSIVYWGVKIFIDLFSSKPEVGPIFLNFFIEIKIGNSIVEFLMLNTDLKFFLKSDNVLLRYNALKINFSGNFYSC